MVRTSADPTKTQASKGGDRTNPSTGALMKRSLTFGSIDRGREATLGCTAHAIGASSRARGNSSSAVSRLLEEARDALGCFARGFLGEEVAAFDRRAGDVVGPVAPHLKRVVPGLDGSCRTPQGQEGGTNLSPPEVGHVVLHIEGGGRAILLADGMHSDRILELLHVRVSRFWGEAGRVV